MLWHQSLKSIHYRTLLIFQNKKTNRFEGQNMGGGDKRHVIPSMSKHGGIYHPHPPRIYALDSNTMFIVSIAINTMGYVLQSWLCCCSFYKYIIYLCSNIPLL